MSINTELNCGICHVNGCYKRDLTKTMKNCPTVNRKDEIKEINKKYLEEENKKIAKASADVVMDNYGNKSRLKETIEFFKEMNYKKIGIAFCYKERKETFELIKVLSNCGFEVVSVMCKVGSVERDLIEADNYNKPPMCNPIAQAKFLEQENPDITIVFGLCVGHDTLFLREYSGDVTIFGVKDRLYDDAPVEAIKQVKKLNLKFNDNINLDDIK